MRHRFADVAGPNYDSLGGGGRADFRHTGRLLLLRFRFSWTGFWTLTSRGLELRPFWRGIGSC